MGEEGDSAKAFLEAKYLCREYAPSPATATTVTVDAIVGLEMDWAMLGLKTRR